jgi:hypothetical protein
MISLLLDRLSYGLNLLIKHPLKCSDLGKRFILFLKIRLFLFYRNNLVYLVVKGVCF